MPAQSHLILKSLVHKPGNQMFFTPWNTCQTASSMLVNKWRSMAHPVVTYLNQPRCFFSCPCEAFLSDLPAWNKRATMIMSKLCVCSTKKKRKYRLKRIRDLSDSREEAMRQLLGTKKYCHQIWSVNFLLWGLTMKKRKHSNQKP